MSRLSPVWLGRGFIVLAVVLALWTVFLGFSLPNQGVLAHEDVVWVGFDVGLLAGLASIAWMTLRGNKFLPLAAAATAALLTMDAWFDVIGSGSMRQLGQALVMAILVELPLSAICWWLAWHAQAVIEQRVAARIRRRELPAVRE